MWWAGCVEQAPPLDYGDPTALSAPTTQDGVTVALLAPRAGEPPERPRVEVIVQAAARDPEASVRVELVATGARWEAEARGDDLFAAPDLPLAHGRNVLDVIVTAADGRRRRVRYPILYDAPAPGLRITGLSRVDDADACLSDAPLAAATTAQRAVCVQGVLTRAPEDAADLPPLTLTTPSGQTRAIPTDAQGRFTLTSPLLADQPNAISLSWGQDVATITVVQDSTPPQLSVADTLPPAPGDDRQRLNTQAPTITLRGTLATPEDVVDLWLEDAQGARQPIPIAADWSLDVPVEPGTSALDVVAEDRAGNQARVGLAISRARVITLRGPLADQGAATIRLDQSGLKALLTPEEQAEVALITVPLRPTILRALQAIQDPERFGVDTSAWGQDEQNVYRLLNMTPDTADLTGSSIEALLQIGSAVGLPTPRMVADLLPIELDDTFLSLEVMADVVLDLLVATHPNATLDMQTGEPVLVLTLFDALDGLRGLGARFGPRGDHPGFLRPETQAKVLEPGFQLALKARSRLVRHDGVHLASGSKNFLYILPPGSAPDGALLEFDFLDPETFSIVGLTDAPKVSLSLFMSEHDGLLLPGASREAGADPQRPGFARGDGAVWGLPPWSLERLIAEAAYRQYHDSYAAEGYQKTARYDAGSITDAAVVTWERGWLTLTTAGGIGDPPAPLYAWDMIMEIAQLRLHDGGLGEGDVSLGVSLEDLEIGLRADEVIEAVRPVMQAQQEKLSELFVGQVVAARCDVFLAAGDAPTRAILMFRAPEDGPGPYPYASPGFFGEASLAPASKLSSAGAVPGTTDTTHEKLVVRAGDRVFAQGDDGRAYAIDVVAVEGGEARVIASPAAEVGEGR